MLVYNYPVNSIPHIIILTPQHYTYLHPLPLQGVSSTPPSLEIVYNFKSTKPICLKFQKCEQNFLIHLLKPFPASQPLWGLLTSLEFRVGVRTQQNFAAFFGDFSFNFSVTWSKFVQSVDFDIVCMLNIDLLRYDTLLQRNRGLTLPHIGCFEQLQI